MNESCIGRGRARRALGSTALLLSVLTASPRAQAPAPLAPLQFLLGEWEGIGDQAGATGGFTFARSVQDHVIVRTNYSNTPAHGVTPASRHDDTMVIYVDDGTVKADYFDSEGHVIRYVAQARPGEVVFVSELKPAEPRYRLTYVSAPAGLTGTFEVAPPGHPDAFAAYLTWHARQVTSAAGAPRPGPEAQVRQAVQAFYSAFNSDGFAGAADFTTDDWNHINPFGGRTNGRAAVLQEVLEVHRTFLKGVTDTVTQMDVRMASPDVAVATVTSRSSAFITPDGVRHDADLQIRTFTVVKRGGRWLIMQDQNTLVTGPPNRPR
jgi:uncharacterized protein (TIGR02246 family)